MHGLLERRPHRHRRAPALALRDCGVDTSNNSQRTLRDYLNENPAETLEKNLREWSNVKGVRAAYKMLRSARYKCLLLLGRRMRGEPPPELQATGLPPPGEPVRPSPTASTTSF